jgi:hypothetical protein
MAVTARVGSQATLLQGIWVGGRLPGTYGLPTGHEYALQVRWQHVVAVHRGLVVPAEKHVAPERTCRRVVY